MKIQPTILLLYTCDAWHSWASMRLVAPFSSRRMLNSYLKILYKKGELTEEDLKEIERNDQTQGHTTNYHICEEEINPDYDDGNGKTIPLIHWLKTVKCPVCKQKRVRRDFDFPKTMRCCEACGCDFNTYGDIVLDPRDI